MIFLASLAMINAQAPKKEFYFEDAKNLDFTLVVRAEESVAIVFSDLDNTNSKVVSWVNLVASESAKKHDAKIDLNIKKLTSTRFQYVWPEIRKDMPEDIKKEYEESRAKDNNNFKRAEYVLSFNWENRADIIYQGGYSKTAGEAITKEVASEKIGKVSIDDKGEILLIEIPLVSDKTTSRKLQIFKGNTKVIKNFLTEKNLLELRSPTTLTLAKP